QPLHAYSSFRTASFGINPRLTRFSSSAHASSVKGRPHSQQYLSPIIKRFGPHSEQGSHASRSMWAARTTSSFVISIHPFPMFVPVFLVRHAHAASVRRVHTGTPTCMLGSAIVAALRLALFVAVKNQAFK